MGEDFPHRRRTPRFGLVQPAPVRTDAATNAVGYLIDAARLRPRGRMLLGTLALGMLFLGVATLAFPFVSDVYTNELVQRPLAAQFDSPTIVNRYSTRSIQAGDPLTRIVIPVIDVDHVVVEGTSPAALRAGAGHYPTSPLPGEKGNVAIAGHRTTYGKPFSELDKLVAGDEILLITPVAVHTYTVISAPADSQLPCQGTACWIVPPNAWEVVSQGQEFMLTLTTCHPRGSFAQRLIVRATLSGTEARQYNIDGTPRGE